MIHTVDNRLKTPTSPYLTSLVFPFPKFLSVVTVVSFGDSRHFPPCFDHVFDDVLTTLRRPVICVLCYLPCMVLKLSTFSSRSAITSTLFNFLSAHLLINTDKTPLM